MLSVFAAFADAALTVMADLYQPSARWTPRYACGVALEDLPVIAAERGDVEAGLRVSCIRETILAEVDDYSGVTLESLVSQVEEILGGSLSAEERTLAAEVFAANTEGTPRRGRTPTVEAWRSNVETTQVRVPLPIPGQSRPRKWDKGGEGYVWLGKPSIAIWIPGQVRGRGEWKLLADAWGYLHKKGVDTTRWATKWWPTPDGGWTPGLVLGGLRTYRWADWENPSAFRKRVERAIKNEEDVGARIPFTDRHGVARVQYILAPSLGDWSAIGEEFREEMRKARIYVGVSVAGTDDQPDDPDVCLCCGYYHPRVGHTGVC